MKFKKLKLYTSNLELEKKFYTKILGFTLIQEDKSLFTIKAGWSELTFEHAEQKHTYHYCFLIPSNKLIEALHWMEKRKKVIEIERGRKVQRFESWNADSFYFFDGSGNLAEFIVRHDLECISNSDFSIDDVLCVNEIGMPTNDVAQTNGKLQHSLGTEFWKGDLKRFGTNGNQEGLFLLPNYELKETWFPSKVKIKAEPFEAEIEKDGKNYLMRYHNEEIEIQS